MIKQLLSMNVYIGFELYNLVLKGWTPLICVEDYFPSGRPALLQAHLVF